MHTNTNRMYQMATEVLKANKNKIYRKKNYLRLMISCVAWKHRVCNCLIVVELKVFFILSKKHTRTKNLYAQKGNGFT